MTAGQIIDAYKAVHELAAAPLPYQKAREVVGLKKRLSEEFETVAALEKEMALELGAEVDPGGRCQFRDETAAKEFARRRLVLMEQEAEIELPAVDLSEHAEGLKLSAAAVEALEGIVRFEEGKA